MFRSVWRIILSVWDRREPMNDFIIKGDSEQYKDCLVCVCGTSREVAEEHLAKMLSNPSENDKRLMEGMSNFRIEEVEEKDCWWRNT